MQEPNHKYTIAEPMESSKRFLGAIFIAFFFYVSLAFADHHENAHPIPKLGLSPDFYRSTCPHADEIVVSVLKKAIAKEPRIAASLLRLLFHDCFVQVSSVQVLFCI
jgi:peroxidase